MRINFFIGLLLFVASCKDAKQEPISNFVITYTIDKEYKADISYPGYPKTITLGVSDSFCVLMESLKYKKLLINRNDSSFLMLADTKDRFVYSGYLDMLKIDADTWNTTRPLPWLKESLKTPIGEDVINGIPCYKFHSKLYEISYTYSLSGESDVTIWATDKFPVCQLFNEINFSGFEWAFYSIYEGIILKQFYQNRLTIIKVVIDGKEAKTTISSNIQTQNIDSLFYMPDYKVEPITDLFEPITKP